MKPAIVMQTDFSRNSSAVAAMYGVCQSVDPEVRLFDLTHAIPPFNIFAGSHSLKDVAEFWPKGTVFVSVVDPGVGTERKGSVALLNNGQYVVTPDNGTLTHIEKHIGIQAIREIDMSVNRWPSTKSCDIFHGRDVFAYTAIRLASGIIDFSGVGPEYPVADIVRILHDMPKHENGVFSGIIESAGPQFGLISSNIPADVFTGNGAKYGDHFDVTITQDGTERYHDTVEFQKAFGYVKLGDPILFVGETGTIQITLHEKNMVTIYGISLGPEWKITMRKL